VVFFVHLLCKPYHFPSKSSKSVKKNYNAHRRAEAAAAAAPATTAAPPPPTAAAASTTAAAFAQRWLHEPDVAGQSWVQLLGLTA